MQSGFGCVGRCRERTAETQHWSLISLLFLSAVCRLITPAVVFHSLRLESVLLMSSYAVDSVCAWGNFLLKCHKFTEVIPAFIYAITLAHISESFIVFFCVSSSKSFLLQVSVKQRSGEVLVPSMLMMKLTINTLFGLKDLLIFINKLKSNQF